MCAVNVSHGSSKEGGRGRWTHVGKKIMWIQRRKRFEDADLENWRDGATSPRDTWSPRRWKRQEGPCPGALRRSAALPRLNFRLSAFWSVREYISVGFKLPPLAPQFVEICYWGRKKQTQVVRSTMKKIRGDIRSVWELQFYWKRWGKTSLGRWHFKQTPPGGGESITNSWTSFPGRASSRWQKSVPGML